MHFPGSRDKRFDSVKVRVWDTIDYPHRFPETDDPELAVPWLQDRKSFGIVFSGGGTRSASATLGQLRALHRLGWLKKAKFITANSGGSWAAVPYTFLPNEIDDEVFLGKYLPPDQITDHELSRDYESSEENSLSLAISETELHGIKRAVIRGDEGYAYIVGKWFLKPFGLADREKFFSFHTEARDAVVKRNSKDRDSEHFLKADDFYLAKEDRPYLVVNATLMASEKKEATKSLAFYPIEISPLYTGVRGRFTTTREADPDAPRAIGGGYMESYGYDTTPPAEADTGDGEIEAKLVCKSSLRKHNKRYRFTLADVIGSSGAAPLKTLVRIFNSNLVFPEFRHWAIHDRPVYSEKSCSDDLEFPHGDGGHSDNIALIPQLVRQVENIVVFVNTRHELCGAGEDGLPDCKEITPATCDQDSAPEQGCVPNGVLNSSLVSYFRHVDKTTDNVVFEQGETRLRTLYDALRQKKKNGDPLVHCERYSIAANSLYKVSAYEANICWVYLDAPDAWKNGLANANPSNPLVEELKDSKNPAREHFEHFSHFPHYKTFEENRPHLVDLSKAQVRALSNLTAWTVEQSAKTIATALDGAGLTD